jgi:GNAT superfamily N-acetyltransferase
MTIRFATSKDKERILKLLDEFNTLLKSQDKPSEISGALFDEVISRSDNKIFVAEENNEVAGTATLYFLPNMRHGSYSGYVRDFFVTEKMRGKGVGTAIFEEMINYCRKNKVKTIKLTTGDELLNAQKFYEEKGGKSTERFFRFDI